MLHFTSGAPTGPGSGRVTARPGPVYYLKRQRPGPARGPGKALRQPTRPCPGAGCIAGAITREHTGTRPGYIVYPASRPDPHFPSYTAPPAHQHTSTTSNSAEGFLPVAIDWWLIDLVVMREEERSFY